MELYKKTTISEKEFFIALELVLNVFYFLWGDIQTKFWHTNDIAFISYYSKFSHARLRG